jgi:hypothetical protein
MSQNQRCPNLACPRNREKDNGVEAEAEYEYEIWHEPNPFPENLI